MNIIRSSYVDFRFVNGVAKHPDLQSDPTFVDFLEVEGDLPRATSTSALSGAGVLRLFNRVGDSIGKITYKMDESNPVITFISLMQLPETAIYITNHLYIIIVCLLQFKIFFPEMLLLNWYWSLRAGINGTVSFPPGACW